MYILYYLLANVKLGNSFMQINKMPMLCDFDDNHYDALKQRQQCAGKYNFTIIPLALTVAVQREDSGPWMDGIVVEHGTREHNR